MIVVMDKKVIEIQILVYAVFSRAGFPNLFSRLEQIIANEPSLDYLRGSYEEYNADPGEWQSSRAGLLRFVVSSQLNEDAIENLVISFESAVYSLNQNAEQAEASWQWSEEVLEDADAE
jgi:hypothetical protein